MNVLRETWDVIVEVDSTGTSIAMGFGIKGLAGKIVSVLLCAVVVASSAPSIDEYLAKRQILSEEDAASLIGGSLNFSDARETTVNDLLMFYKGREYAEGLESNGGHFAASQHFFHVKTLIEASNVFKIIRLLPKGAALHIHDVTVPRAEYVVNNLTYWPDLYYCNDKDYLTFRFFASQPSQACDSNKIKQWRLVSELRNTSSSQEFVNSWFLDSMTLLTPEPDVAYPNINYVWKQFEAKIATVAGIANYLPALRDYYYQTLQEFYDDNVMYIEERGLLTGVYLLNQTELSAFEILALYKEVTEKFVADHPDFWGAKYIYAPHRFHPANELEKIIDDAIEMKRRFPGFFAGFDLVGQEDVGTPLVDYLPQLLKAADNNVSFFFHAGETAWHGTKIDENLMDALLLNTTRIGHAYALASHPVLANMVRERKIAVELCPISNQVLKLVEDVRNHPVISLMKDGFPLVVSSDDPGIWGASALSYDWYITYMGMAGAKADLRFLKQLAMNSIEFSAMTQSEKDEAMTKWNSSWSTFLDRVIAQFGGELPLTTASTTTTTTTGRNGGLKLASEQSGIIFWSCFFSMMSLVIKNGFSYN